MTPRQLRWSSAAVLATLTLAGGTIGVATAGERRVLLGGAGSFAVLAGTAVTNSGPSTLSGDLGVSPGTAITGFPPGTVTGTIHATNAVAAQAQVDLTTAYDDAAGRSASANVTADLGGQTLVSGVYAGDTLALTGTLTLDGQGDPAAVFIFQSGSTLITASASRVLLINGASACNVFWQVATSATLGTASSLAGTVLATSSITTTTGAAVQGRLLARNAAVTLDTITITSCGGADVTPAPSPSPSPAASPSPRPAASSSASPAASSSPSPAASPAVSPAASSSPSSSSSPAGPSPTSGATAAPGAAPTVRISDEHATPGGSVTVTGRDWRRRGPGPGGGTAAPRPRAEPDTVSISFTQDGRTTQLTDLVADADFTFDTEVTVPASATSGTATVTASGSTGDVATAELTVITRAVRPVHELARTGASRDPVRLAAWALALLLSGAGLICAGGHPTPRRAPPRD